MEDFNERVCLCALNRVSGNSPISGRELLEHYGSASAAVQAPHREWEELLGVPCEHISQKILDESAAELEKLAAEGKRFIGMDEEDYPTLLRECPDCPLGLYVQSGGPLAGIFEMRPCIAVVGTRDISPYGKEWCRRIVKALADSDTPPVIVSGLAFRGRRHCAYERPRVRNRNSGGYGHRTGQDLPLAARSSCRADCGQPLWGSGNRLPVRDVSRGAQLCAEKQNHSRAVQGHCRN